MKVTVETVEAYRDNGDGSRTDGFADLVRDVVTGVVRVVNFRDRNGKPMYKTIGQTIFLRFHSSRFARHKSE